MDVALAIEKGLWRFSDTRGYKHTYKYNITDSTYIILENKSTLYTLVQQDNNKVILTKYF